MKTSVMKVHDMLSVLTVDEVEKRISEIPGIASATVNYAAGNVTVRYDETLLDVADIKVMMHQRGQQSEGESQAKPAGEHKPAHQHAVAPTSDATSVATSMSEPAVRKAAPSVPAAMPASVAPAVESQDGKPKSGVPPPPSATASTA